MSALFEKAELRTRVKQTDVAIKVCRDALDVIAAAGLSGSELDAQAHARLGGAAGREETNRLRKVRTARPSRRCEH